MRFHLLLSVAATLPPAAIAHPEESAPADEIIVNGRAMHMLGQTKAGSEGVVGYDDFKDRPFSRTGELIEVIPGMVATQHSGTGKANQYFLRGFNLDHGTDFSAFIDGVPVNFRTHGHGQGYLDLNFIVPELVERIHFRKGPYYADVGDFTTAGTADFKTYDSLDQNIVEATFGEFGYRRGLAAASVDTKQGEFLIGIEAVSSDGAYELDEDLQKIAGLAKFTRSDNAGTTRVTLSGYDASWNSTDQVPLRAIESGLIPRLGFIDDDLGGNTTRLSLSVQRESDTFSVSAYAVYYDFQLFSDFTYFANDPVNGDEFEQRDERVMLGGAASKSWEISGIGQESRIKLGGDLRYDNIYNLGLFNTADRMRVSTVRDDDVEEFSAGLYVEYEVNLTDALRASLGLRGDYYAYDVSANIDANSGDGSEAIVTPTASIAWRPYDAFEIYANYGEGFHSNDARGATISIDPISATAVDPVELLVRARGGEIGARLEYGDLHATLVGFWLDLDGELVFVGDAGTTEPNNPSRRFGIEFNGFWRPADWASFDLTAGITDAKFQDTAPGEDLIPQSVKSVVGAGVSIDPSDRFTTTLRLRHFGKAPLNETGSVYSEPTTILNLGAYYDLGPARLSFEILNLLDSKDADITYFFESQLPGEPSPVEDIHLHPVEPRQLRGSIGFSF